jgi:hypothetical protein
VFGRLARSVASYAQGNRFRREHFVISWIMKGRTDGRNPPRRFHEVPRAVRSSWSCKEVTTRIFKRFKLRRGIAIDPSQSGALD